MFCSNCGNQIGDNAAFCPICGSKLESKTEITHETTKPGNNDEKHDEIDYVEQYHRQNERKKNLIKRCMKLGIFAAVLIVICVVFCSVPFGKYIFASHYASQGNYAKAYTTIENLSGEKAEIRKDYYQLMFSVLIKADEVNIGSDIQNNQYRIAGKFNNDIERLESYDEIYSMTDQLFPSEYYPNNGNWENVGGRLSSSVSDDRLDYYRKFNLNTKSQKFLPPKEFDKLYRVWDGLYAVENSSEDIEDFTYCLQESYGLFDELEELKNGKKFDPSDELDLINEYSQYNQNALEIFQKYTNNTFSGYYDTDNTIERISNTLQDAIDEGESCIHFTNLSYDDTSHEISVMESEIKDEMIKYYFAEIFPAEE